MKKKYINYLLFALVLSLCIFYFSRNLDGFQTSPIDFTNFSGTLTGIRVVIINGSNYNLLDRIKGLLGGNLTDNDIKMMKERPNGDLIYPYFYINPTGDSGSSSGDEDPYNLYVEPEIATFFIADQGFGTRVAFNRAYDQMKEKILHTINFSRNPKIPPIVLTNKNINVIYNNIYANLYKKNLRLVSLILNKTIDYPPVDYSQYNSPIPTLTPKIVLSPHVKQRMENYIFLSSITVKMSLLDIIQKFREPLLEYPVGSIHNITLIKSDKTTDILRITVDGGNILINYGDIQPTAEIKVYKLDFLQSLFDNRWNPLGVTEQGFPYLFEIRNDSPQISREFIVDDLRRPLLERKIPDSVIQNYISPILLKIKEDFITFFKGTEGGSSITFSPDQILTLNLSDFSSAPPQEIKVDIVTEMSVNNTPPSSILDQVRKILCI
uniref:Uncharacterized protein n=1 Tax=viral metagenome TaxID=1070528 RepID=A0A6C0K3J1_9ZZZZ